MWWTEKDIFIFRQFKVTYLYLTKLSENRDLCGCTDILISIYRILIELH